MSVEGGYFKEGIWYTHCVNCNLWYPDKHTCPPKEPLWIKLYMMYRGAEIGSTRRRMLLNAWVTELGGKIVDIY